MKIYVASSWRNDYQQEVVRLLRDAKHNVYDFRNPTPGDNGFNWREIDPNWQQWDVIQYLAALKHPIAETGFKLDYDAMQAADACVLVLPCGRSAHLEAGYFVGAGKPLFILLTIESFLGHSLSDAPCAACGDLDGCHKKNHRVEPELMYKMATGVFNYIGPLIERLAEMDHPINVSVEIMEPDYIPYSGFSAGEGRD